MGKTYIIAEAGVNHNGSLERALEMIDKAAEAGADAVKFQTFQADKLVSRYAPKAEYQTKSTDAKEAQLDMLKKLQLDQDAFIQLHQHSRKVGIDFISTPFDIESAHFLGITMGIDCIKIPSGEITNAPLLLEIAKSKARIILSTGMSNLGEIEAALGVIAFGYLFPNEIPSINKFTDIFYSSEGQQVLARNVSLLHCTTEYPAPFEDVNLRAIATLQQAFQLPIGFSDHTVGGEISIAAVALGAKIIEKHFTLDRTLPGPDHTASIEPDELKAMIRSIRHVELALGHSRKAPGVSEMKNIPIVRKSLVAAEPIKKGQRFTDQNVTAKRPGLGLSPFCYWDMIGKTSNRDYETDELISILDSD